ncbi:MAG TPA: hypothetical protein VKT73_09755 [Xanthobacteraceae bacterium]|nr:hypothetical protein [Xanthobacteraceae bacterium]
MSHNAIQNFFWWLCLVVAPAVLAGMELFHPAHFTADPGMFAFLCKSQPYDPRFVALAYPGPDWWFMLHMIQTPLIGLIAVGMLLLLHRVHDEDGPAAVALAWVARTATLAFLIYYTALDSTGGTGLARLIVNTQNLAAAGRLTPEEVRAVALVLDTNWVDPWVGGVGSFISHAGSYAVLIAAAAAAGALYLGGRAPWPALLLLIGFGWQIFTSHASPHGPIGFSVLIAAAIWIWVSERRTPVGRVAGPEGPTTSMKSGVAEAA